MPLQPAPDGAPADPALRRYRVRADDRTTLNAMLDRLREAEVEVESITPLRQSLEDYFIDVVDSASRS